MNRFKGMVVGGVAGLFCSWFGPVVPRYAVIGVVIGVAMHLVSTVVARALSPR